jgi:putative ABC transport system substrate-binding protein
MLDVRRRQFLTLLGGAAAGWPLAARAQQPDRVRRLGLLANVAETDPEAQAMVGALQQGLKELGWVEGRNLLVDRRWGAGNPGRVATLAKELVGLQPDVIVGYTTPAVLALRKETSSIPVVFVQISDPIGTGFVTNMAHPGGNITGFTNFESSMAGKWAEMLKEIAPGTARVAFLFNPETAPYVRRYYLGPLATPSPNIHGSAIIALPSQSNGSKGNPGRRSLIQFEILVTRFRRVPVFGQRLCEVDTG